MGLIMTGAQEFRYFFFFFFFFEKQEFRYLIREKGSK